MNWQRLPRQKLQCNDCSGKSEDFGKQCNVCVCFVPAVFVYYMYAIFVQAIFSELSSELHFVEYKPLVKYERLVRLAIWPNTICKIILSSPVSFQ